MSTTTITVSTRADIAPPARRCERPDLPDTPPERPFLLGARPVEGSHRARRLLRLSRMNPAVPIAPRTLLRALVTRALGEGGLHAAASLLLSPLSALAPQDEVWVSSAADFDAKVRHPTPVVLVHGFLGNPGDFRFLRRFLVARGFHNFATFSYAADFDAKVRHPTPVVLVHGFLGNPGEFRFLRRFLVARGFHNFATFSY